VAEEDETRQGTGFWRWLSALGAALLLGGGIWALAQFAPGFRASWPAWKAHGAGGLRETLLWLEFFGSILLSVLALLWLTAILFALFLALVRLSSRGLRWTASRPSSGTPLRRVCRALLFLLEREREMGTALNLAASAAALGVFRWASRLPLDAWDLGIQVGIALAIELIVLGLLFREGRVGWLSRR
jgi:hypothetical protein